ncbi:MAG TPA: RNA-binding protein [Nitrospirales bacterium]|nr:RNA-binding protein [Nitrospirales bacterium]
MAGYLCVDLLPSSVTTAELTALVAPCRGVRRCLVATNREGGSLGFAFIETSSRADAERILEALDGMPIRGRSVRVSRFNAEYEDAALTG